MNRIYRRVWNPARQCWMVASELAASRGKSSTLRVIPLRACTVLLGGLLVMTDAGAASLERDQASDESSPELPALIDADNHLRRAFGLKVVEIAPLAGQFAIQIGERASATNTSSVAIGFYAKSTGFRSVALGGLSEAIGSGDVAIGNLAKTVNHTGGIARIAIGDNAFAGTEGWTGAIALGGSAKSTHDSVAIGYEASVTSTGAVALGRGALANEVNTVSVGNATTRRRIVNVADARLTANSTDAVTGKQLHATNQNVSAAQTVATSALARANQVVGLISQTAVNSDLRLGGENTGTLVNVRNKNNQDRSLRGVKDGILAATSNDAVTGRQLFATNQGLAAAQNTATAALGAATTLGGLIGQSAADGSMRIGGQNGGSEIIITNRSGQRRNLRGLLNGVLSATSTDAVTGQQLHVTNQSVAAAQSAATAAQVAASAARTTADSALSQATTVGGLVGQVSPSGNLRLGAENSGTIVDVANTSGGKRRIYNIANGVLAAGSTDAVTGQQLFTTNTNVEAQRQTLATHSLALSDQSGLIAGNRSDLDALRSEFDDFDPDLEGVVRFETDGAIDLNGGKVRGVAAGDISSAASTDAVNGGQLFATNRRVDALADQSKFVAFGENFDRESAKAGRLAIAIGDSAEASLTSEGAVAVGAYAVAAGSSSVALGRAALVHEGAARGFALGVESQVAESGGTALGSDSSVEKGAVNSVAIGTQSVAKDADSVSFGHGTLRRRLVNVSRGYGESDAVTVAQLSESLFSFGGGARMDADGNVISPTYKVQGATQNNVGDALAALDSAVITGSTRVDRVESQLRSVFQDSPGTRSNGLGQISLVGANGMVLSNVANGLISPGSRDAVNGSQLFEVKQDIARNRRDLNELKVDRTSLEWVELRMPMATAADINFGGSRLTGISNGRISDGSSDAITGNQLYQTNERVSDLQLRNKVISVSSTNEGNSAARTGERSVAIGEYSFASVGDEGGTAVGHFAQARASNSVAIGQSSSVSSFNPGGLALGSDARADGPRSMAIGERAWVFGGAENSVAIGAGSEAMRSNEVSIGTYSNRRRLTSVANGIASYDAATAGQLRDSLSLLGGGATLDRQGNILSPSYRIQGGQQNTVGDALNALDGAVITAGTRVDQVENQLRSVFQDSPGTRRDGLNQLTFAGANGMVLSNVANGAIAAGSRDAVNGGQLHSLQQQLNGRVDGLEQRIDGQPQSRALSVATVEAPSATPAHSPVADESVTPPVADTPVADTGAAPPVAPQANSPKADSPTRQVDTAELEKMLARANEYTDGAISNFEHRLDKMDKRFNRMAAMSSAQTAMAMNTAGLATYNRLGAGVGYSEGESAMAVGYQRVLNDKGSATFSLNGAFTNSGEQSVGLGVGIGW